MLILLALVGGGDRMARDADPPRAPKLRDLGGARPHLTQMQLCQHCAHDYNPDAVSGPKTQNPALDGLAVDGNVNTAWPTEHYYSGQLGKPGVGLVRRRQQAGPGPRDRDLHPDSPGWRVQIWGSNSPPDPDAFDQRGRRVDPAAQVASVQRKQPIPLDTPKTGYRYYLVWITALPPAR